MSTTKTSSDCQVPVAASQEFFAACPAPGLDLYLIGGGDHRLADHRALLAEQILRFLA